MRYTANGHQLAPVRADDRHIYRYRVDDRGRMHLRRLVPAALHPVARFPMIGGLNGFDPFGLFHTVYVRDIDPEWISVLPLEWHTVPPIGQHDPLVRLDRVQRNYLKKLIGRANL